MPLPDPEPELLTYASLAEGRRFPSRLLPATAELVAEYVAVTGDDDRAFRGDDAVVPPGLAGVWARLAYVEGRRMPAGGFMARQAVHLLGPAAVGTDLKLAALVARRGDEAKREVTLECSVADSTGVPVLRSTIDARWGEAGT